jgi:hypothetical protein
MRKFGQKICLRWEEIGVFSGLNWPRWGNSKPSPAMQQSQGGNGATFDLGIISRNQGEGPTGRWANLARADILA